MLSSPLKTQSCTGTTENAGVRSANPVTNIVIFLFDIFFSGRITAVTSNSRMDKTFACLHTRNRGETTLYQPLKG